MDACHSLLSNAYAKESMSDRSCEYELDLANEGMHCDRDRVQTEYLLPLAKEPLSVPCVVAANMNQMRAENSLPCWHGKLFDHKCRRINLNVNHQDDAIWTEDHAKRMEPKQWSEPKQLLITDNCMDGCVEEVM